ncbi:MAG TPA: glucosyl-3-phosphoglycerate synthase [Acidimicrobiales bacterium]|jgi:glucosyl-3-phosphoglycerate synthase|nr:glucosyl-3-phosphoglycerate synthase [Acidimicrobiales bacterium]
MMVSLPDCDERSADVARFLARKGSTTVAVCIPARNEESTVGSVVAMCRDLQEANAVDELVVIDDHSEDLTAAIAAEAGARVVRNLAAPGKGQALECGVAHTTSEILVFLDADVTNIFDTFVTSLVDPLLDSNEIKLVKATYARSLNGKPNEGGRVTEILARPLLARFFPELADVGQPLAGECALWRTVLDEVSLSARYGIEIGLLIDVYRRYGRSAIVDADLVERAHRNRPLSELSGQASDILDAVLSRVAPPPSPGDRSSGTGSPFPTR